MPKESGPHDSQPVGSSRFVVPDVSASALDTLTLQVVGRLGVALTGQLAALVFHQQPVSTMNRQLGRLTRSGLVWRQAVSLGMRPAAPGQRPVPQRPHLAYGLTPEGKAYLDTYSIEEHPTILDQLITRDRRAPALTGIPLADGLKASWWLTSAVAGAMRNRFCTGIYAQVDVVTVQEQKVDGLLGLRLNATAPERRVRIPWGIWDEGGSDDQWYWFTLEVDRGTEALNAILRKAVTYRDLTTSRSYMPRFGSAPTPVFLVPTRRRGEQIGEEFKAAWPASPVVVTTLQEADYPTAGTLWGAYRTLVDGQPKNIMPLALARWKTAQLVEAPQPGRR